ncbi:MAG: hypothetical protein LC624_09140 [Halobacteriales archaeon]|nr:hypothetical protein [Halobacteriales archaeon]
MRNAAWLLLLALVLSSLPGAQAASQPDLKVTSLGVTPGAPTAGQGVRFTAVVHNSGGSDSAGFDVGFEVDGDAIGVTHVADLAAGQSKSVDSPTWVATQGSHTAVAAADAGHAVNESGEGNNDLTKAFSAGAHVDQPDIKVSAITFNPPSPAQGQDVAAVIHLVNAGEVSAGAFTVTVSADGNPMEPIAVARLDPLAEVAYTRGGITVDTTHHIQAIADSEHAVAEADEFNNELTVDIGPSQPKPDLVVTGLSMSPPAPNPGASTTLTAYVKNQGSAASGAARLAFLDGNATIGTANIPALPAGQTSSALTATWRAVAGNHTLRAVADDQHAVGERDESNNEARLAVTPGRPAADLAALGLTARPAAPDAGTPTTFSLVVRNTGTADAGAFDVTFSVDGKGIGTSHIPSLAAAHSATLASPTWSAVAGTHTVTALADSARVLAEPNEQNNQDTLSISVGPADAQPVAGTVVPIVVEVRNKGAGAAGPFSVVVMVDGQRVGSVDVAGLAAGAGTNATWAEWHAAPGAHTFQALVDPVDAVRESDEGNNAAKLEPTAMQPSHPKPIPDAGLGLALLCLAGLAARRRSAR